MLAVGDEEHVLGPFADGRDLCGLQQNAESIEHVTDNGQQARPIGGHDFHDRAGPLGGFAEIDLRGHIEVATAPRGPTGDVDALDRGVCDRCPYRVFDLAPAECIGDRLAAAFADHVGVERVVVARGVDTGVENRQAELREHAGGHAEQIVTVPAVDEQRAALVRDLCKRDQRAVSVVGDDRAGLTRDLFRAVTQEVVRLETRPDRLEQRRVHARSREHGRRGTARLRNQLGLIERVVEAALERSTRAGVQIHQQAFLP